MRVLAEEVPHRRADQAPQEERAATSQETSLPHRAARLGCLLPRTDRPPLRRSLVVLSSAAVLKLQVAERLEVGRRLHLGPLWRFVRSTDLETARRKEGSSWPTSSTYGHTRRVEQGRQLRTAPSLLARIAPYRIG